MIETLWGPPLDNFHNFPVFHLNGVILSEKHKAGQVGALRVSHLACGCQFYRWGHGGSGKNVPGLQSQGWEGASVGLQPGLWPPLFVFRHSTLQVVSCLSHLFSQQTANKQLLDACCVPGLTLGVVWLITKKPLSRQWISQSCGH